jgi:GPI mannosyltransferase 3
MAASLVWPKRLTWLGAVVAVAVRAWFALTDDGIYWPDEVYQSLEPAHRLVFGYGYVAWEFIEGARSWAFPGLIAGVLKVFSLLGIDHPRLLVHGVKLVFCMLGGLAALGAAQLARVCGADERHAPWAAWAVSVAAPLVYFGPRAMSENAAAVAAVWGLAWVWRQQPTNRQLAFGASLLGLAVCLRLQVGVFAAGALAPFVWRRQWREVRVLLATLGVWAAALGGLDAATWHDAPGAVAGGWFHSVAVYVRFNLIEGKAAAWGVAPAHYYLKLLMRSPVLTVAAFALLASASRRALALVLLGISFVVLHSMIPHKEFRFITPAFPLLAAGAAVGVGLLGGRLRALVGGAAVLGLGLSAASLPGLTWADVGAYPERATQSAWDDFGPVNRLLWKAHDRADACGVRVDVHPAWHGGFTHLHRRVPLHPPGTPHTQNLFNYIITGAGSGLPALATEGNFELIQLPGVICSSLEQQNYSWRLP